MMRSARGWVTVGVTLGALMAGRVATATPNHGSRVGEGEANSPYYTVRMDLRRCVFPMCGGYFIQQVNRPFTVCADGSRQRECYVTSVDFSGLGLSEEQLGELRAAPERWLVRGETEPAEFEGFPGPFAALVVSDVWLSASSEMPLGRFVRLTNSGIVCFAAPCPSVHEGLLNSLWSRNLHEVSLEGVGAAPERIDQALAFLWTEPKGILAAGTHYRVEGPAGRGVGFQATQFYLPIEAVPVSEPSDCVVTGCSGHVCAEEEVMTTCEWRPEYECIRLQTCERQDDGRCGWTPTDESDACFDRRSW